MVPSASEPKAMTGQGSSMISFALQTSGAVRSSDHTRRAHQSPNMHLQSGALTPPIMAHAPSPPPYSHIGHAQPSTSSQRASWKTRRPPSNAGPAQARAALGYGYFLPRTLSHVGDCQVAVRGEAHAPRVSQARRPYLRARAGGVNERVVRRYAVWSALGASALALASPRSPKPRCVMPSAPNRTAPPK